MEQNLFENFDFNVINYQTEEEWLCRRKEGIGGSDIASICGQNIYRSPLDVYLDKIGAIKEKEFSEEQMETMWWGKHLERTITEAFEIKQNLKTMKTDCMFQNKKHDFALATIDKYVLHNSLLETKYLTYNIEKSNSPKEDGILTSYLLQVQWYLFVCGFSSGWLAILDTSKGKPNFIIRKVDRDDELIGYMLEIAEKFWKENVLKKIPPTPESCNYSDDIIKYLYPQANNKEILKLPDNSDELVQQYNRGKELEAQGIQLKEESGNKLKVLLGEHETGITPTGFRVNWKNLIKNTFQKKLFKEENPDMYEIFTRPSKERRFSISDAK